MHLGYDDGELSFRLMEAERALADAESQYQRIADALPYGIWTCGPDGELLHISQSFLNLLGMTLEECQQFGWWGKLPPDEIEATQAHWKHCLLHAVAYNHEHHLLGRDGVRHAVLVRGVPVKDDMGMVIGWVGINLDIDDRKRAEAALKESERRFRTMADEAPVLIWMTNATGESTYYNRRWVEMTGAPLDLQLGRAWLQNLHPDDQERTVAVYENALRRRKPFENSYRIKDAHGNFRLLLDRGVPRFLEDRSFAGYVGCCTDVTDMEAAQKGTDKANERYRMVCDSINSLVYDFDVASGEVQRSKALETLLGISLEDSEPTAEWFKLRVHPEDVDRIQKTVYGKPSSNGIYEIEYRVRNADNVYIPVFDRAVRSYDASGNVTRIVGCISKINERRSLLPGSTGEELLRTIVEFCPTAAFMFGGSADQILVNKLSLELFGIDEMRFRHGWMHLIHPDDRKVISLELELAQVKVQHLTTEFRVIRPDGQLVEVQLEASPIRDGNGVLIGFVGLLANITLRKQSQRILEQSEAQYRSLAEAAPDLVVSILPDLTCDFVNARWCEYTGLSLEASRRQGWHDAIHADDIPLIKDENAPNELELRMRRHDGEYRWFLLRRTHIRDASGAMVKHLVTGTDIHQLKSTAAALKESENRLSMALNIAGVLLFGHDRDLRFTWVYTSESAVFARDRLLGNTDADVLSAEDAEKMTALKRRVLDHGETVHQMINIDFEGKLRALQIMMKPLLDESGAIVGITGAAIDHTEKMQLAAQQGQTFLAVM